MRNKSLAVAAFAAVMSSMPAFAAVELVSPADGESVRLLPSIQKKIMALGTKEERYDALEPERAKEKGKHRDESTTWRRSRPVTLKWRSTEGEKGPWLVRVGTDPEMGKYEEFQIDAQEGKSTKNEDGSKTREWSCTLPSPNFEIGRTYWWKVWSRVRCSH